jgi:hypothetical protein
MAHTSNNNNNKNKRNNSNSSGTPYVHRVSNEPHVWNRLLKDSTISFFGTPRTSKWSLPSHVSTKDSYTAILCPIRNIFFPFVTTWFNHQHDVPVLCDPHKQLHFACLITTKPHFIRLSYVCVLFLIEKGNISDPQNSIEILLFPFRCVLYNLID